MGRTQITGAGQYIQINYFFKVEIVSQLGCNRHGRDASGMSLHFNSGANAVVGVAATVA